MSTLVEELEQAATDADVLSRLVASMGMTSEVARLAAAANWHRARAARVRAEEARPANERQERGDSSDLLFRRIAGPIDAPTKGTDE